MEVVLLIIAGVVLYMLYNSYQDYLKNPYKGNNNNVDYKNEYKDNPYKEPYKEISDEDKIKKTEFGILTCILKNIASSDGEICPLEKELISSILDDIAAELSDYKNAREILQNIFDNDTQDLDTLAKDFEIASRGEYKKRLKVIEFLFSVAYADGKLDEKEREKIIDVAAIFELGNDDFNKIYDDFESMYSVDTKLDKDSAMKILGLSENYSQNELDEAYHQKIKEHKSNIFKNNKNDPQALKDIDEAYHLLQVKES